MWSRHSISLVHLGLTSLHATQALQKLIYVSALVFGERKAAFLLPWRRIAEVNDATIARAITDNGKLRMVADLGQRTSKMQVRLLQLGRFQHPWLQGVRLLLHCTLLQFGQSQKGWAGHDAIFSLGCWW